MTAKAILVTLTRGIVHRSLSKISQKCPNFQDSNGWNSLRPHLLWSPYV